ncbi:DUF2238 domain-containing protein [Vreelandella aquamarina]|uniref:DUF2238 domain-containing protein n=1 Tax=Vreelandella aquamarina TaxID=77097 RepID=UPI00384B20CB
MPRIKQVRAQLLKLDPFPVRLFVGFVLFWIWLARAPYYRSDWLLENILVFSAVPVFGWLWYRSDVSRLAWLSIFLFLVFHEIGAHYTYSEVPYDQWLSTLLGFSLDQRFNFERNQYDRWVHFLYGLLLFPLIKDLLKKYLRYKVGLWNLLSVMLILSHSALYEIAEWLAVVLFPKELGESYLGAQGDIWDAQKDMVLALLGVSVASALSLLRYFIMTKRD